MADQSATFLAFRAKFSRAVDAGLVAAGEFYKGAIVSKLAQGYTTGRFVSGDAAASVERTAPFTGDGNARTVSVGTDQMMQMYWELGGFNAYTRKFERVEHWRNALMESGPQIVSVFGHRFNQALQS